MAKDNFSTNPAKFLSIFVERMVPDYVREDHPMFVTFLRKYFEYLERGTSENGELGEYTQITDLIQNLDVDKTLDDFIPQFESQYLSSTPTTAIDPTVPTTPKNLLAKNIQEVYREKGTERALDFLFRRDFDTDVEVLYPKQWLMKSSGSVWYEPQWITVLTDKETTNPDSEYYGETEMVQVAETVRSIYNKKIIGQWSGATAFVDMDESITTSDYENLLLTEIDGEFVRGEPIWEDTGTQLNAVPYMATIISDGIRTEGECIINGASWSDSWMHVNGQSNHIDSLYVEAGAIQGLTSGATAILQGRPTDWTKLNLSEVEGAFEAGEKVINTAAYLWDENPTGAFCTNNEFYLPNTFFNKVDCESAMHPEAWNIESEFYGQNAGLRWYETFETTTGILNVENTYIEPGTERPSTRESCEALGIQEKVKTAVWKTNGYWLDSGGFLSSDRKLQDNSYYQDFSYVVRSDVPIQAYREVLKKLVHPVGLKLFAEFSFYSNVDLKVEMPTDYTKLILEMFSYLDVAMDIWDQEDKKHGTVGRAHTGFGLYLDKGFDEYVVEIMQKLDNRSVLIEPKDWEAPGDHLSVGFEIYGGLIGSRLNDKLWTVSTMNDRDLRLSLLAIPEKTILEFNRQLKVLPIEEFPSATQELEIVDSRGNETDGRMISAQIWEFGVYKHLRRAIEWVESFMPEAEYAPEKSYGYWEANRENSRIHNIYGITNDVIDSVRIGAFEDAPDVIHSRGTKSGFAPLVETVITKGLELPDMLIGSASYHVHYFNGERIANLVEYGEEVTARPLNHAEARALMDRDYFQIPEFHGANLVCGGIMTPAMWGDWVASETDERYNGVGECFRWREYDDPQECRDGIGGDWAWQDPFCSDREYTEGYMGMPTMEECREAGHSWGYFTLKSLHPMKGHASYFVKGQVVDRQRGRTADPLSREQARQLIDGEVESVTLYDNVGWQENGEVQYDEEGLVTQGGLITSIDGRITSAHYHEYTVTYDPDWEQHTDWQNNPLSHGFVYTPVTTWLCFNYRPELPVDPTAMGGMDFMGNKWPQNVFMDVPDSYVGATIGNPDATLQHNQVWPEKLNPNVDWVKLYSSNFIQTIPGSGEQGDLLGVDEIANGQDICVIQAYPNDPNGNTIAYGTQAGRVYLVDSSQTNPMPMNFIDIKDRVAPIGNGPFGSYDERGLMGIAFHPDYNTNGKVYIDYIAEDGIGVGGLGFAKSKTVISEFTADTATHTVDPMSERILLEIPQPEMNHNGGQLEFGPDGYLYIAMGDGGGAGDIHGEYGNAQNPTNLLGAILRIDVDTTTGDLEYGIPADNPFIGRIYKEGQVGFEAPFREEIYAMGLRNPWRFSFESDGTLWCPDVGQDKFEEINKIEAGGNYGWRVMEAYHMYEESQEIIDRIALDLGYASTSEYLLDLKKPIHEYSHGIGLSILGGYVYEGNNPDLAELRGNYIFGDWSTNWMGQSGHLFALTENTAGLGARFDVLPNDVNGASHSHKIELTAAEVEFLQSNPGQIITTLQTDTTHAEYYTHTISVMWSASMNEFLIVTMTNPEGHDKLVFTGWTDNVGYSRRPLSFWFPDTQTVLLETMQASLMTMGRDGNGEIYFSTRPGVGTAAGDDGVVNSMIFKITNMYDSADVPVAAEQIPAKEVAHVHSYKVTYDDVDGFVCEEIEDIEMQDWDEFYPIWSYNDPQSHIHPVNTAWSGVLDEEIIIGSSAGWYYDEELEAWQPYDTGADSPWTPEGDAVDDGTIYIESAPIVLILPGNEYGQNSHTHYFDSSSLDTFGENTDRIAVPITRLQAQELANGVIPEVTVYSSITDSGAKLHYHQYRIYWNPATRQFIADEVAEFYDPFGTGEYIALEEDARTHEHTLTVDGLTTNLGWNGTALYNAPDITTAGAHDWDNLEGSRNDHVHSFSGEVLDTTGTNSGRRSLALTDEQATDLINGDISEVFLFTGINVGHYHKIRITYDANTLTFIAEDIEKWNVAEDETSYELESPRSHAHTMRISGVDSTIGFNEMLTIVPTFRTPGFPYPGGSHPHFWGGTVVGPFAWNNSIDYADGLSVEQCMDLIDGNVESVVRYGSIEGAHFHDYTLKWDDVKNIFYVQDSWTWIRGGIEDETQDETKYYPSQVLGPNAGLHWHNLVIEWNPNFTVPPQQEGGSIYITREVSDDEVLRSQPQVGISTQSTTLSPVVTRYDDDPLPGDTTIITTYSDLVTTTTTSTTTVTTTTTTITYYSDGTDETNVAEPVIENEVDTQQTTEIIENLAQRKTIINGVLQANNPPDIFMMPSYIDGQGAHDHLLYEGCALDTEGPYAGRMCEPLTLGQTNELVNAQDSNYGFIIHDSPNGNASHYHGYTVKFNPNIGETGEFVVIGVQQFDRLEGSGDTVHSFRLSGGYHVHKYDITVEQYISLLTGTQVIIEQQDTIHSELYTHTITIAYSAGQYSLVNQTSDFDNHDTITYLGSTASGGEWYQNMSGNGAGDHVHEVVVDDSNVWPEPV